MRQNACRAIARIITAHLPELSVLLTQEQGKPLKGMGSEFELGGCAALKRLYAHDSLYDRVCQSLAAYGRQVPMGGIKSSGLGVEFGQEGLETYTTVKVINAPA